MTESKETRPGDTSSDRGLSRRAAIGGFAGVAGAAWVAPQILSVPAASAATCFRDTLDWDSFAVGAVFSSATINGVLVTLATTADVGTTLDTLNRTIRATPNGGINEQSLRISMVPNAIGRAQTVVFTFDTPVNNIRFTITDLDNVTGGWGDRVEIITPGYTSSIPTTFVPATPAGNVIGDGTNADPFRNSNPNFNYLNNSNRGNVTISYVGPISSFSFRYSNAANSGSSVMLIAMSDISWDVC